MSKKIFLILSVLVFSALFLCGCKRNAPIILFNHNPISKENLLDNSIYFNVGQRIYYIFITKKPIKSDLIRVQLVKKEEKVTIGGLKVVQANDYRVYQDQVYYYTNYIVVQEKGMYYLQIFDPNFLYEPLAREYFFVK